MKKILLLFVAVLFVSNLNLTAQTSPECETQLVILAQELTGYPESLLNEVSDGVVFHPGKKVDTTTYTIGNVTIQKFKEKNKLGAKYQVEIAHLSWKWRQTKKGWTCDILNEEQCAQAMELLQFVLTYLEYIETGPELIHQALTISMLPDSTLHRLSENDGICERRYENLYCYTQGVTIFRNSEDTDLVIEVEVEINLGTPLFFTFSRKGYAWEWYTPFDLPKASQLSKLQKDKASAFVWWQTDRFLREAIYLKK